MPEGAKTRRYNVCAQMRLGRVVFTVKSGSKTAALDTALLFGEHVDENDDTTTSGGLQRYNSAALYWGHWRSMQHHYKEKGG